MGVEKDGPKPVQRETLGLGHYIINGVEYREIDGISYRVRSGEQIVKEMSQAEDRYVESHFGERDSFRQSTMSDMQARGRETHTFTSGSRINK